MEMQNYDVEILWRKFVQEEGEASEKFAARARAYAHRITPDLVNYIVREARADRTVVARTNVKNPAVWMKLLATITAYAPPEAFGNAVERKRIEDFLTSMKEPTVKKDFSYTALCQICAGMALSHMHRPRVADFVAEGRSGSLRAAFQQKVAGANESIVNNFIVELVDELALRRAAHEQAVRAHDKSVHKQDQLTPVLQVFGVLLDEMPQRVAKSGATHRIIGEVGMILNDDSYGYSDSELSWHVFRKMREQKMTSDHKGRIDIGARLIGRRAPTPVPG
ncbi:MAG: hypothetical protein P4M15_10375 [Alphaproteobacteria bacterium]|nr:hypothetical protein [Alphaproteobacteria bacterium]